MTTGIPKPIWKLLKTYINDRPQLKKRLSEWYDVYLGLYYEYLIRVHGAKYKDSLQCPSVIMVDPMSIKYSNDPGFLFTLDAECDILGGRWDKSLPQFSEQFPLEAFYQHYQHGVPWEETAMMEYLSDIFMKNKAWSDYCSFPEAWSRLWKLDELYNTIDRNGYKSQKELQELAGDDPIGLPEWQDPRKPENHEVAISIGRSGQFIFEDGRHRLAIAKVLELDKIPVYVVVRHKKWHNYLVSITEKDLEVECNHPDVNYIINNSQNQI